MRRLLFTSTAILLAGCSACLAQVSTMGSTAMGLPSTPGTIVTSPLNGPSPFSVTTQPGTADTTLAPIPLASDPTTPGTVVTCSTPTGQIGPGTPTVTVTSMSTGTLPSIPTAPTMSATPDNTTAPILALSAQPATSFMSTIPGSTAPAQTPATPAPSPPSINAAPIATSMASSTATLTPSTMTLSTTMMPTTALGTIPTPFVSSTTGTISPASPLGSASATVCSSAPGGPPTNGAAVPLSTPDVPSTPSPGTIQPAVTQLAGTSIDPTMAVMPTPNTPACAESVTMNLATPGMMAPANATGAAATPGVSPAGC
ncbi:MAG TPA: hypothetical protein VK635_34260 [Bradyrhizobium sp.]|nr:hypothetical protein [Bradyrhizobium sp.]